MLIEAPGGDLPDQADRGGPPDRLDPDHELTPARAARGLGVVLGDEAARALAPRAVDLRAACRPGWRSPGRCRGRRWQRAGSSGGAASGGVTAAHRSECRQEKPGGGTDVAARAASERRRARRGRPGGPSGDACAASAAPPCRSAPTGSPSAGSRSPRRATRRRGTARRGTVGLPSGERAASAVTNSASNAARSCASSSGLVNTSATFGASLLAAQAREGGPARAGPEPALDPLGARDHAVGTEPAQDREAAELALLHLGGTRVDGGDLHGGQRQLERRVHHAPVLDRDAVGAQPQPAAPPSSIEQELRAGRRPRSAGAAAGRRTYRLSVIGARRRSLRLKPDLTLR